MQDNADDFPLIFQGGWRVAWNEIFWICILSAFSGPPTCHSLEFLGSMVEGQRLSFIASYSGGWDSFMWISIRVVTLLPWYLLQGWFVVQGARILFPWMVSNKKWWYQGETNYPRWVWSIGVGLMFTLNGNYKFQWLNFFSYQTFWIWVLMMWEDALNLYTLPSAKME